VTVHAVPAPGLAEAVEGGEVSGSRVAGLLDRFLEPVRSAPVDVLVLGCTHYGFLRGLLAGAVGDGVAIIDTADPVARQVQRVLEAHGLLSDRERPGRVEYKASGDAESLRRVMARLRQSGVDLPEE
jgi:glutamate racemase